MAGGAGSYEDDEGGTAMISEINVTPLVDIVLVLLIIMMVAAPLIVNNPSIKVELPKASQGDETQKSTISLTLTKEGLLFFNQDQVTEEVARARIVEEVKRSKEVQAIVSGDKGVNYGAVMRLIDLVKSQGVTKFALNIDNAAP